MLPSTAAARVALVVTVTLAAWPAVAAQPAAPAEPPWGAPGNTKIEDSGAWSKLTVMIRRPQLEGVIHKSRLKKLRALPHDSSCTSDVTP